MPPDDHEMRRECAEFFTEIKGDSKAIRDDLKELKTKIDGQAAAAEDRHVRLMRAFNGSPTDPSNGLNVRMDRLEQSESRRKWLTRVTGAGVIGLVLRAVYHGITGT